MEYLVLMLRRWMTPDCNCSSLATAIFGPVMEVVLGPVFAAAPLNAQFLFPSLIKFSRVTPWQQIASKMPQTRSVRRILLAGPLALAALYLLYTHLVPVVILTISCVLATCLYRISLHPLSRVPGPRLAALSNIWYAYHVRNGLVAQLATTLHQQYGPAVRVGPNEVWFNSKDAFKAIYSASSLSSLPFLHSLIIIITRQWQWL